MSVDYLPCVLKNNKHGWQIEFHAADPVSGVNDNAKVYQIII